MIAKQIVKATDPDIIKLTEHNINVGNRIIGGYYFNPKTKKLYSELVRGHGPENLYELKLTSNGQYRMRDMTRSPEWFDGRLQWLDETTYNKIMAE